MRISIFHKKLKHTFPKKNHSECKFKEDVSRNNRYFSSFVSSPNYALLFFFTFNTSNDDFIIIHSYKIWVYFVVNRTDPQNQMFIKIRNGATFLICRAMSTNIYVLVSSTLCVSTKIVPRNIDKTTIFKRRRKNIGQIKL